MASTSQQDMPRLIFPCVCFHQTEEPSVDADVVTNARDIFVKFCPKSVKIVKKIFSILPLKEDKKETRCRWIIVYCQDDDAQLSMEDVACEIRTANMQDTRIIKEVPFYVDKRLHIGVEYLVTTCRYYQSRTGAISRSTVPELYKSDVPRVIFPCVCFPQTEELSGDADVVANACDIFVKFCPKSVKIVKKIFSILPLKEDKKETRCQWIIVYCQDDDAQLSSDEVILEIRAANIQDTRIIKEIPYYIEKRLYVAVDYLVTTCRYYRSRTGAISRSTVPEHYKSGESLLTDSTRLEAIEHIINNMQDPVKEMCLMLELNHCKKEQLDNWLVDAFQDCLPEHFDLLARYEREIRLCMTHSRHDEYPTLLHFAARFGLEKFAFQILERPQGAIACDIINKYDKSPAEIAEDEGHLELAMIIKSYTSLNPFNNMYRKLEEICRKLFEMDEDTISSEDLEDLAKVCLPFAYFYKFTLSSVQLQSLQPTIQKDSGCPNSDGTYSDDILHSQNLNLLLKFAPIKFPLKTGQSQAPRINHVNKISKECLEIFGDSCDNKVPSDGDDFIKLVDDWNNRNNVQKSFKEKKEQLKEMWLRFEKFEMETENVTEESDISDTTQEMLQTQDEKNPFSPRDDSMYFEEPVESWNCSTSFEMTRAIMEASVDNYPPVPTMYFNLIDDMISRLINIAFDDKYDATDKDVVTDDKNKITDNVNEATNNDINIAHDDKNTATDDKNEASDDMNIAIDNTNEAANDKNEATDDINEAIDDMNKVTHDKNKTTDDKNEANDNVNESIDDMNKAINDTNEVTHDKNEATANDKNEASDDMNIAIDNMNEAANDKNEATDYINEAIDDMNEITHDKNEANVNINESIDDMNETAHDKNEATVDNRVENASCTMS